MHTADYRLTRFYLHCLCQRVIVLAADMFVAGSPVRVIAHKAKGVGGDHGPLVLGK